MMLSGIRKVVFTTLVVAPWACVLIATSAHAQSAAERITTLASTAAGPARPKLRHDGEFALLSSDGVPYRLYYYFEHSGGFTRLDSHVFYPPPYHLVVDEGRELIRYDYDSGERTLTMWVRQATDPEVVANKLRDQLRRVAVEEYEVGNLSGTDPYRIAALPLTSAHFELTKNRRKSDEVVYGPQLGDVAIYFRELSADDAQEIIEDLGKDTTQLVFRYAFAAISDEKCNASFDGNGVQDIDIFKDLSGKGGREFVGRHQVVKIADELVERDIFKVSCGVGQVVADLTNLLLDRLKAREDRAVADWSALDRLMAFDEDDFALI